MTELAANESADQTPPVRRLGRLPMKSTRKALMFSDFFKFLKLPKSQTYWTTVKPIPLRTYGNDNHGCCTIAKQAVAATRMERLEQRKTIHVTDEEVLRVYYNMTTQLYGGGDTGAYEDDALNRWRNPDLTFRDDKGNPYTIDAYLRINAKNHDELRAALALAGAKGIAICLNLPAAWQQVDPPATWGIPEGQPLIGPWMPGTWGGHSLWGNGYTTEGLIPDHTWPNCPNNIVTWEACSTYLDEAHLVIDSVNAWKSISKTNTAVRFDLSGVRDAVNAVSSIQLG